MIGKILRTDIKFLTVITVVLSILFYLSLSGSTGESFSLETLLSFMVTVFALYGMYRLGKLLSSTEVGWLSAFILLFSPLFFTEVFHPWQGVTFVAATIWSLLYYAKKNYLKATIFVSLAIVFNEQAFLLVGVYLLAELLLDGVRSPKRLLLLSSPLLVIPLTGLINIMANGHFSFPSYISETLQFESGWLALRIDFFAVHLISENYRWFPIILALAGMMRGLGRDKGRRLLPFVLVLIVPLIFFPPERLFFLIFVTVVLALYTIRERLVFGKLYLVFLTLPLFVVFFNLFTVSVTADSGVNLLRYLLPAYPVVILGVMVMLFRYYPKKVALAIAILYLLATLSSGKIDYYNYLSGDSYICEKPLLDYREVSILTFS